MRKDKEEGSVELIVLGIIAALIIVLAIPYLRDLGTNTSNNLNTVNAEIAGAG